MLTLSNNNQSELPGVYINKAIVVAAVDHSGKPTYNDDPESIRDLAVEVEFNVGQPWNKKVMFSGNLKYKKNDPKEVADWYSAFIIRELFHQTGCFNGLTKDELKEKLRLFSNKEIPIDFLLKIRGKVVYIVSYVKGKGEDGKLKYGTWSIVDKDPNKLLEAFKVSISKGYPQNYRPDLLYESNNESIQPVPNNGNTYNNDEDFMI